MFVHEIMNDSIPCSADLKKLLMSTSMSHFWHMCLKKMKFWGTYSAHVGTFTVSKQWSTYIIKTGWLF